MLSRPGVPPQAAQAAVEAHGDRLFRLCFVLLGSAADAEDAVQETLLKYLQKAPAFASAEHEKAWLLRVRPTTAGMCTGGGCVTRRRPSKSWTSLHRIRKAVNFWTH